MSQSIIPHFIQQLQREKFIFTTEIWYPPLIKDKISDMNSQTTWHCMSPNVTQNSTHHSILHNPTYIPLLKICLQGTLPMLGMGWCSALHLHKVLYNLGLRYPSGHIVFYLPPHSLHSSHTGLYCSKCTPSTLLTQDLGQGITWFSFSFKILLISASL